MISEALQGKRIFLTGATGFIGRFLVANLLKRKGTIHVLVRKDSQKKFDAIAKKMGWDLKRITVLHGDMAAARCGLTAAQVRTLPPAAVRSAARLRVGFMSNGFGAHPTGLLTAAFFEALRAHDAVDIHLFALTADDGSIIRRRLQASAHALHDVGDRPHAEIAGRIMHPETVALLQSLPQSQFESAFLDAWTQREAHVKAVGGGLFRTRDELPFDVQLASDATVHRVRSRGDGTEWSIARFLPYPGTRAAVAAPGSLRGVRIMDWNDVVHDT